MTYREHREQTVLYWPSGKSQYPVNDNNRWTHQCKNDQVVIQSTLHPLHQPRVEPRRHDDSLDDGDGNGDADERVTTVAIDVLLQRRRGSHIVADDVIDEAFTPVPLRVPLRVPPGDWLIYMLYAGKIVNSLDIHKSPLLCPTAPLGRGRGASEKLLHLSRLRTPDSGL